MKIMDTLSKVTLIRILLCGVIHIINYALIAEDLNLIVKTRDKKL